MIWRRSGLRLVIHDTSRTHLRQVEGRHAQHYFTGLQYERLFKPLPPTISDDTAFHDRWAAYLPGWELPKLTPDMLTPHVGFILDYTSEIFHRELRRIGSYGALWERWFASPLGQWSAHDLRSINRTFSGLTKLIFPSGVMEKEDARLLLRLAIELRLRVTYQFKKQEMTIEATSYQMGVGN